MLRVGLTGGLGAGKSTALRLLAECGAHIFSSDEVGRELMQPGQAVFAAIMDHFGPGVVDAAGRLDRAALARIAFGEGRVEELNAIVHPEVIARQAALVEEIGSREPHAVVVVESALLLETQHAGDGGWRTRFDRLVLVRAAEERKIARFVQRSGGTADTTGALEAEARRRLAAQMSDDRKAELCDYVLTNDGELAELQWQVDALWPILLREARR